MRLSVSAPRHLKAVPAVGRDLVRRTTLLDRLSRTVAQPLVLLTAPPGYGKTTALMQWVEQDQREVVWVTVEDADNDPNRMLGRLAAALGDAPAPSVAAARPQPTLWHLVERIRTRKDPVVVVLDDIHHLHPAPVPDLLVELAVALPAGSQLVMASRSAPPLRLARPRVEGRCAEFGPADSAFDTEEAGRAVALAGVDIGDDDLMQLVERTEGWPAGVCLAAMALRCEVDLPGPPGHVTGDDAYIADYFRDELLARLPAETVRFLLCTSVLDRLCAPLCDAVLGASDSAARLADVARRNLFLVPLDHHRQWYRYHRLFGEALVAELRRREPAAESRAHLRAAAWFEQQGLVEEAVAHRVAGGDRAMAGRLINRYAADFIGVGRIATVRRWIQSLGRDTLLAYPPVTVTAAWTAALSGESERAHYLLHAAERASFRAPCPTATRHSTRPPHSCAPCWALRASTGCSSTRGTHSISTRRAARGTRWRRRSWESRSCCTAIREGDRAVRARRAARRGAAPGRGGVRGGAALAARRGLSRCNEAELWAAEARHNLAVDAERGAHDGRRDLPGERPGRSGRGDRESARRGLGIAVRHYCRVPPTAFPWLAAQAALVLGDLSVQLGDPHEARLRLDEARRHLARLHAPGVLRDLADALDAAVSRTGDRSAVASTMALSAAEERVLRLLPTHLCSPRSARNCTSRATR